MLPSRCLPFRPCLLAALSFLLAGPSYAQEPGPPPPELDTWVERAREIFEVPGIGLAIVKDGHVIVARGYGVRRIGETTPVDERTRFGIASNTKAFTATALGLLVEENALEWDGRVIDYLPWFQMWDPWVTREITVRDLLVHRSGLGLGQGDLLYWPESDVTREEIVRAIRHLEPATSFRSAYAYDNILYHVADYRASRNDGYAGHSRRHAGGGQRRDTPREDRRSGATRATARCYGHERRRGDQLDGGRHGEVAHHATGFRAGSRCGTAVPG
jgi:CubicO group peptidase (beta-lactamase class C family)